MLNRVVKTTLSCILQMILVVQEIDYTVDYCKGKADNSDFFIKKSSFPDPKSVEEQLDLILSDDL